MPNRTTVIHPNGFSTEEYQPSKATRFTSSHNSNEVAITVASDKISFSEERVTLLVSRSDLAAFILDCHLKPKLMAAILESDLFAFLNFIGTDTEHRADSTSPG